MPKRNVTAVEILDEITIAARGVFFSAPPAAIDNLLAACLLEGVQVTINCPGSVIRGTLGSYGITGKLLEFSLTGCTLWTGNAEKHTAILRHRTGQLTTYQFIPPVGSKTHFTLSRSGDSRIHPERIRFLLRGDPEWITAS